MEEWAKTILSVYRHLEPISNAIDNLVRKKCIYSAFAYNRDDIYSLSDNVIKLINRKINLINLKVIAEQARVSLGATDQKILVLAYIDGVSTAKASEILGLAQRSYFRRKSMAVHSFALALKRLGYTDDMLTSKYGQETWLNNIYTRAVDTATSSSSIVNAVIREFNKPTRPVVAY